MTLAIKDSLDVAGTSKSGSPAQNSENIAGKSPRSNPVCLEVSVSLRSLPGENGNAPGAAGPIREEGRSVIVFDNGGVLRMANPLAPGRTVILSNQQGRDVVCRVVSGRKLPSVKGYIEVEFIEPVNDFWNIHQTLEPVRVPAPAAPEPSAAARLQPFASAPVAAPGPASRPVVPAKEVSAPPSGAPTFADVAGLVQMSPSGALRDKENEPADRSSRPQSKDESAHSQFETTNLKSSNRPAPAISELPSERPEAPPAPAPFSTPAQKQAFSNDSNGKGGQFSVPSSFASSASESRGRMPLLLGGAALVFAGLGAGYFFMHRGTTPRPTPSVTEASQPSASPTSTSRGLLIAPNQQPAVEPAPPQTAQPISTVATGSAGVAGTSPSDSQNVRQRANGLDAKQPDRAMARRQPIPNLKMSSPTNASKTLAKLPDGPSMGSEDLALSVAPGESSSPNFAVRAANQPAAPPDPLAAISSATSAKTSQDAKLISSTRPVYPAVAKESNIQGRVAINATIDEVGNVVGAKAVSGPMSLRQAAVDAVTHWKYSPARIGGKPASSQITISLDFRLN